MVKFAQKIFFVYPREWLITASKQLFRLYSVNEEETFSKLWSYNLTVFKSCWQKAQFQAVHCLELSIFFSFILPQNQKTFYLEFYFRGYKTDANLFTPFIILY